MLPFTDSLDWFWLLLIRYWWLKIKALAEMGDWEVLEKFSKEKKPPIGFRPFAEVCIERNNFNEAHKYIRKVSEPDQRAKLYIRVKYVIFSTINYNTLSMTYLFHTFYYRQGLERSISGSERVERRECDVFVTQVLP